MASRFDTILTNFRRRDNIRDFIEGLHDSECWPYPDGEEHPQAATCDCCGDPWEDDVEIREDKAHELKHLYLINVTRYHPFAPLDRTREPHAELTDVSIELCPEEGPGAYTVHYEVADKTERAHTEKLNLHQVATLRSAFMHRYEWVVNKRHSVNRDRHDAVERAVAGLESDEEMDNRSEQNEGSLSEEEDHDALVRDWDEEDMADAEEDSAMQEVDLHVAIKPLAGTAQKLVKPEFFSSDIQGCVQACGPSVMPKSSELNSDDEADISGTTMFAGDESVEQGTPDKRVPNGFLRLMDEVNGRPNKRVRTREPSVEL